MTAARRVMFFNPVNATPEVDRIFLEMARNHRLPGTEVHVASLPASVGRFTHIEFRTYEAIATTGILRAARAAAREGFDAFVIGCFYDTALHDAREISGDMMVTAPCVAACEIAASLANRFGVIVGRRKWAGQMEANIREIGHGDRLTGLYEVGLGVDDFQRDHAETARRLIAAGRRAVEEDHAEALVLGCTMEIGFYKAIEAELGVPVIDPAIAAFKRAEYGAELRRRCGWTPSRKWTCEPPSEAEMARFGLFDDGAGAFGNRFVVEA
ncbi:MAG: hydantoin racemase [Rhodovulum sulfidophilum]|uniref:Hydantoin racemase n=1 Tax=Rhodovulum sulfidophilum TaxID=35806 RepID=A0A2W5N3W0_RHOSU|nr:MAG: hydantoin racemase [Rhodovulum sulfidophilum]